MSGRDAQGILTREYGRRDRPNPDPERTEVVQS